MTDRDSRLTGRADESLAETPLRQTELDGGLADPGAGSGSDDEAQVAERGAGDHSPFDASEAYTGLDEDDALNKDQRS